MPFLCSGTSDKPLNLLVPILLHQQKSSLTPTPFLLSRDGQMRKGSRVFTEHSELENKCQIHSGHHPDLRGRRNRVWTSREKPRALPVTLRPVREENARLDSLRWPKPASRLDLSNGNEVSQEPATAPHRRLCRAGQEVAFADPGILLSDMPL